MPIGAAIMGSAVVGAGASALASGSAARTQANAATQAAQVQSAAAERAVNAQLGMFNTVRGDLSPFRNFGMSALPGASALLGIPQQAAPPAFQGATTAPAGNSFSYAGTAGENYGIPAGFLGGGATTGGPDWSAYLSADPGIAQQYAAQAPGHLAAMGVNSLQDFAKWHWDNVGQHEAGRLNPYDYIRVGETTPDPQYAPQAQAAAAPAAGGAPAPTFDSAAMQSFLESTPGYQFTRDQGMKAVNNSLYAKGLGGGAGALGKGLARFVTGLADQTYGAQYNRYLDAAKLGESAAATSGSLGTTTGANVAQTTMQGAQAAASGITGAANAGAAGTIATGNAIAGAAGAVPGALLTNRLLGMYQPAAGGSAAGGMSAGSFTAPNFMAG